MSTLPVFRGAPPDPSWNAPPARVEGEARFLPVADGRGNALACVVHPRGVSREVQMHAHRLAHALSEVTGATIPAYREGRIPSALHRIELGETVFNADLGDLALPRVRYGALSLPNMGGFEARTHEGRVRRLSIRARTDEALGNAVVTLLMELVGAVQFWKDPEWSSAGTVYPRVPDLSLPGLAEPWQSWPYVYCALGTATNWRGSGKGPHCLRRMRFLTSGEIHSVNEAFPPEVYANPASPDYRMDLWPVLEHGADESDPASRFIPFPNARRGKYHICVTAGEDDPNLPSAAQIHAAYIAGELDARDDLVIQFLLSADGYSRMCVCRSCRALLDGPSNGGGYHAGALQTRAHYWKVYFERVVDILQNARPDLMDRVVFIAPAYQGTESIPSALAPVSPGPYDWPIVPMLTTFRTGPNEGYRAYWGEDHLGGAYPHRAHATLWRENHLQKLIAGPPVLRLTAERIRAMASPTLSASRENRWVHHYNEGHPNWPLHYLTTWSAFYWMYDPSALLEDLDAEVERVRSWSCGMLFGREAGPHMAAFYETLEAPFEKAREEIGTDQPGWRNLDLGMYSGRPEQGRWLPPETARRAEEHLGLAESAAAGERESEALRAVRTAWDLSHLYSRFFHVMEAARTASPGNAREAEAVLDLVMNALDGLDGLADYVTRTYIPASTPDSPGYVGTLFRRRSYIATFADGEVHPEMRRYFTSALLASVPHLTPSAFARRQSAVRGDTPTRVYARALFGVGRQLAASGPPDRETVFSAPAQASREGIRRNKTLSHVQADALRGVNLLFEEEPDQGRVEFRAVPGREGLSVVLRSRLKAFVQVGQKDIPPGGAVWCSYAVRRNAVPGGYTLALMVREIGGGLTTMELGRLREMPVREWVEEAFPVVLPKGAVTASLRITAENQRTEGEVGFGAEEAELAVWRLACTRMT